MNSGYLYNIRRYKPLFILFFYIIILAYLFSLYNNSFMLSMMGIFFVLFSFFKVINLLDFKEKFSKYDTIAKYVNFYGYCYPFLELFIGILFLMKYSHIYLLIFTILILSSTNLGVVIALRKKEIKQCACLGTYFNLPLTTVTFIENFVMIVMAILLLF